MKLTKTTFELDPALLARLKSAAALTGRSVRELLTEGAEWVLGKAESQGTRQRIEARSATARARLRQGYGAVALAGSDEHDQLLYPTDSKVAPLPRPSAKRRRS